ncbi:MAG: Coenzyme F420 hydrogenase/dehydrogenase, beta subunit C-terminal domain [Butyrivibrio sp.]|nr:Coenzyme F420 hydrogenase/dehydrogenase, beta subunit C-terminal domain [Butyrivibrio sp.]
MFLVSGEKTECFGCESCVQACEKNAISMVEDKEGFRYPVTDKSLCVNCGKCFRVCPHDNSQLKYTQEKYAFGGYNSDSVSRFESTSGGAFSAIVESFCDRDYAIFGAEAQGLKVFHSYITDKSEIGKYRKSKYSQSVVGQTFKEAKSFLKEGKKVLFSGTPCQIAGLRSFLGDTDTTELLTVEVICEGVPSPLYVRKLDDDIEKRYGKKIDFLDYRYTGKSLLSHGKWDFQVMRMGVGATGEESFEKEIVTDRWFNPFWSVWLQHLMSRPSCYHCMYTTPERVADITLGDLWGVHIYCPELYGNNGGSSLVFCNTEKGKRVFEKAKEHMTGHELRPEDALKYQSPMRKTIDMNADRDAFIADLQSNMGYKEVNRKWAKRPSLKLLIQKYIWGNRQKVFFWNLGNKLMGGAKNA